MVEGPWYISAAAVRHYMAIAGIDDFDEAAKGLSAICQKARLAKDVGPGQRSQIWRAWATIGPRRARLELTVSLQKRPEGPLAQLIGVRYKG